MASVEPGTRVRVISDGDNAEGVIGVVVRVYASGRLRVDLPDGGVRNLAPENVEVVEAAMWRPVIGYEGMYEVSSDGRVRSLDRVITRRDGRRESRKGKELVLGEYGRNREYLGVRMPHGHVGVHRLIYEAFVVVIPNRMEIDHIDGNPRNNVLENLRLATRSQNHANRGKSLSTLSVSKGVSFCVHRKKWVVQLKKDGKHVFRGRFNTETEARDAYRLKARLFFGVFARIEE